MVRDLTAAIGRGAPDRRSPLLSSSAGPSSGRALGLVVGARLHRALPLGPVRSVDRGRGGGWSACRGDRGGAVAPASRRWPPSRAGRPGPPPNPASPAGWRATCRCRPTACRSCAGSSQGRPPGVLRPAPGARRRDRLPAPALSAAAVTTEVSASTVKVEGQACDEIFEGSGFAVAPDLIVTNAHVVAGEAPGRHRACCCRPGGGSRRRSSCSIPAGTWPCSTSARLGETPLSGLGPAHAGVKGAVFGHPSGQNPRRGQPGVGRAHRGDRGRPGPLRQHTTRRNVLVLAARPAHGDSGGPLVTLGRGGDRRGLRHLGRLSLEHGLRAELDGARERR